MRKKIFILIGLVSVLSGATATFAGSQSHPKSVSTHAKVGESRGPSETKPDTAELNKGTIKKKGVKGKRGPSDWGTVHFDNRSDYYVDCYVDNSFVGTAPPEGDVYDAEPNGEHSLYASAPGVSTTWGPLSAYVGGTFTWRMWP